MKNKIINLAHLFLMLFFASMAMAQSERIVRVTPGYATVIVCPTTPELVTVGNMEAFSVQSAGSYVLIKPLVSSGATNMFIKAGSDTYNLLLQISDSPDMEVRLASAQKTPQQLSSGGTNGHTESTNGQPAQSQSVFESAASASSPKPISSLSPKAMEELSGKYKITNRYAHSVNNSNVIFAVDYLKQFKDRLLVIGTIINNSNIPYDVGFVSFNRIDYKKNLVVMRKKVKETEMEPVEVYYDDTIPPHSSTRLLFVFEKHGFSYNSTLKIKCNEESGLRDLELEVPGSIIE
jgi:hypothetical protein